MIIEKAPAKINLTLRITGKRKDGYHSIESVMQTVSLCDFVCLEKTRREIVVDCAGIPKEKNIAAKAASAFFAAAGIEGGAKITLEKHIPIGGGLGGGSADAAAVLRGLNRLYPTAFTAEKLRGIAVSLGMDVPFLIEGGTCFCQGAGEIITPLCRRGRAAYLVCAAGNGVSTARMYAEIDKRSPAAEDRPAEGRTAEGRPAEGRPDLRSALAAGDIGAVAANLHNDFFPVFLDLFPENKRMIEKLYENGALGVSLTGSGNSFFGVFPSLEKARAAETEMKKYGFARAAEPAEMSRIGI